MKIQLPSKRYFEWFKKSEDSKINIAIGSVRSGKSTAGIMKFCTEVLKNKCPNPYIDCVVARRTSFVRDLVVPTMQFIFGDESCKFIGGDKPSVLFMGIRIYVFPSIDYRSINSIMGLNIRFCYVEEITNLYDGDFFTKLLSRLSAYKDLQGFDSRLWGVTNTDAPNHWLKKDYIDKPDKSHNFMEFTPLDNPNVSRDYYEWLKTQYTGFYYDRFILNKWVGANGLVYPMFNVEKHLIKDVSEDFSHYYFAIDYGTFNTFALIVLGINFVKNTSTVVESYGYNGREDGAKSDNFYLETIRSFMVKYRRFISCIIDPSASSFIALLGTNNITVQKADNNVVEGIASVSRMFTENRLFIYDNKANQSLVDELSSYQYDSNKLDRDEVVKKDDHFVDALRYGNHTVFKFRASSLFV